MGYISDMSSEARARSLPAVVVRTGPPGEDARASLSGAWRESCDDCRPGSHAPEGWMKKCVLSKGILLKGSVCVLCLSYLAEVRAPCVQRLGGGYSV